MESQPKKSKNLGWDGVQEGRSIMFFELTTALRESQALDLCQRFESDATCERALCAFEALEPDPKPIQADRNGMEMAILQAFWSLFGV